MNPCIDCSLDNLGCHAISITGKSFAIEKCDLWYDWQFELHQWRPDKFPAPQKPKGYELTKQARKGDSDVSQKE